MKRPQFTPEVLDEWDRLTRSEQEQLQDDRLRIFVRTQLIHSPYYRKLFAESGLSMKQFKGLEDLEKVPFTSKKDVVSSDENPSAPKDIILQPSPETFKDAPFSVKWRLLLSKIVNGDQELKEALGYEYRPATLTFTTGRSSLPTPFFYSLYDLELQAINGERLLNVIGAHPGDDSAVNLFPYAPHLAFWQTFMASFGSGLFMLNTGGGRIMGTEKILALIEKMKPTILIGIPGYFYHLLRKAEAEGYRFTSIKKVALGGEKVTPLLRKKIKNILEKMGSPDVKVMSILGFTESRQCWGECPSAESSGFHLYPDLSYVEVIDPETGKVLGEGQTGELVYTSLMGRTSCLLRYRTGDMVEGGLVRDTCPDCGRTVPRLATDIRRVSNKKDFNLSKVKGTLVDFNIMTTVLSNLEGIEEWQLVVHKLNDDPLEVDQISLYLALENGAEESRVKEKVVNELKSQCEVAPNQVTIESLESLLKRIGMEEKMKEERIVDRR